MAPRDVNDDDQVYDHDEQAEQDESKGPAQRNARWGGVLGGMICGILLIGGALVALNETVPLTRPEPAPLAAHSALGGVSLQEGAETARHTQPAAFGIERTAGPRRPFVDPAPKADSDNPVVNAAMDKGSPVESGSRTEDAGEPDGAAKAPESKVRNALGTPRIADLRGTYIPVPGPAIEVNAAPFNAPEHAGLISVVFYGGTGEAGLTEALDGISMPLTLSVRADRPDQVELAQRARERGFEVLAELPLVANGVDTSAELTGWENAEEVEIRIADALVTLSMAVGAVAPDGAPILYDVEAMSTVLKPVAAHSFLWVEPRIENRSAAAQLSEGSSLKMLQANIYVPPGSDSRKVRSALETAADQARAHGSSVVFIEARPVTLRALVSWSFGGITPDLVLAPISAVVRKRGKV